MSADVATLGKRYESLKLALGQLAYEDTVDDDRDSGLARMETLKAKLSGVRATLSEAEAYSRTLAHMRSRSEAEKLASVSQLVAFEGALSVHGAEVELAEGVLRTVNKARDEEAHALAVLHSELRDAIATLDKKLEARRHEVKSRQERARLRLSKMQEELALRAAAMGDMTEEEERAMLEKASNISKEAAQLKVEKLRVQAEADASEAEFQLLCFSAGLNSAALVGPQDEAGSAAGAPDETGGAPASAPAEFVPPDPSPIVDRFAQLDQEMGSIRDQMTDNQVRCEWGRACSSRTR